MSTETGAWMPMYWGDYFGDTMHLTTEEHGAYLLLIGTYWRRGKPLPDDDYYLSRAVGVSKYRWKNFRKTLVGFFQLVDTKDGRVWKHKRLEKEILRSIARLTQARAAGVASAIARGQRADQPVTPTPTPLSKKEGNTSQDYGSGPAEPAVAPSAQDVAEVVDKTVKLLASGKGPARANIDFSKPENRQAYANAEIAKHLGISNGGWDLVMAANDPEAPEHIKAVKQCLRTAKKLHLSWERPPDCK